MRKFVRIILVVINILVIVGLLLAYLCCFVNPGKIWWLSFFGLGYIYLLVVNLCFIIFWLFTKKKKYALFSLTIILLGWNMIWRNVQVLGKKLPSRELDSSIKLISYNVHMFQQADTKQPDGSNLNIFDFIRQSEADIVCMQEFASTEKGKLNADNLAKLMKTPYYHIEYTTGNVGLGTYCTYPIIHKQLIYSDNTANACMYSDLKIGEDTIRLYNIHLKSIGFNKEERKLLDNAIKREYDDKDVNTIKAIARQMIQASVKRSRQVKIVIEIISQSPYPVIICGDFNDPPISYSYQKVRGNRKDAFMEAGQGMGATYHIGRISSQRIDYILHSSSFKAYDYENPHVYLSDHFPVMCRLVKQK